MGLQLVLFGETLVANVAVKMCPPFEFAKRPPTGFFFWLGAKLWVGIKG